MRVIGGFRISIALGAPRFRTTDRGHARRLCGGGRREGFGRGLRLRAGTAACALGMPRFAVAALVAALIGTLIGTPGGSRLAFAAIAPPGSSRLALAPWLAAATRTFAQPTPYRSSLTKERLTQLHLKICLIVDQNAHYRFKINGIDLP